MKKLFIGHASEDKDTFVRALAETLKKEFDVWYDEDKLVIGSSLLEEISKGIADCDYGVVILSPNFFKKKWTNDELKGLFALEEKDRKVILPIWKEVDEKDIVKVYPILADRKAAKAIEGVDKIVSDIKFAIDFFEKGRSAERSTGGFRRIRSTLQKREEKRRSDELISSSEGVIIGSEISQSTIKLLMKQFKKLANGGGVRRMRIEGPSFDDYHSQGTIFIGKLCLHAEYNNLYTGDAHFAKMTMLIGQRDGTSFSDIERQDYRLYVSSENKSYWHVDDDELLLSPEDLVDIWLGKFAKFLEKETPKL